jgi:uncharacterized protein YdaT
MSSKSNHVISSKDQGWSVRKYGAFRASRIFDTKKAAVRYAREISRNEKTELYIHKKNGTVQNRNSYGINPILAGDKRG